MSQSQTDSKTFKNLQNQMNNLNIRQRPKKLFHRQNQPQINIQNQIQIQVQIQNQPAHFGQNEQKIMNQNLISYGKDIASNIKIEIQKMQNTGFVNGHLSQQNRNHLFNTWTEAENDFQNSTSQDAVDNFENLEKISKQNHFENQSIGAEIKRQFRTRPARRTQKEFYYDDNQSPLQANHDYPYYNQTPISGNEFRTSNPSFRPGQPHFENISSTQRPQRNTEIAEDDPNSINYYPMAETHYTLQTFNELATNDPELDSILEYNSQEEQLEQDRYFKSTIKPKHNQIRGADSQKKNWHDLKYKEKFCFNTSQEFEKDPNRKRKLPRRKSLDASQNLF